MHQIIHLHLLLLITFSLTQAQSIRKRIIQQGDLMIGALLPVHEQPNYNGTSDLFAQQRCGHIRDQYGIQRVEALLYILDKLNKNYNENTSSTLLPGIRLGLEIRDECWESKVALEETIGFIKDTISFSDEIQDVLETVNNDERNEIYADTSDTKVLQNTTKCPQITNNTRYSHNNRIIAVVGPSSSSVAINVQNLLQLFNIPQVGFSATSADLSNKKMYKTFFRVVPSDYLQVKAMISIVLKFNWTFLHAVYTDGSYGQAGMEAFRNEITHLNICLAEYEKIRADAVEDEFDRTIVKLNKTTQATVIVCFCYGETVRGLLKAINRFSLKGRFLILGSDGWSDRIDVAQGFYEEALGSFSVKAYSLLVKEFDDYFTRLNPANNKRNVWFNEYWEDRFNCFIDHKHKHLYPNACQRKCPMHFIEFQNQCFFISRITLNARKASNECKEKHHLSTLINTNDIDLVVKLVDYLKVEFNAIHVVGELFNSIKYCQSDSDIKIDSCLRLERIDNINFCVSSAECNKELPFICKYIPQNDALFPDSLHNYQQDPKMSYVMNSLLAIAYGLKEASKNYCPNEQGRCEQILNINGSDLLKHIIKTEFDGITGKKIYFDLNGDPPGRYVILNVQRDENSQDDFIYKEVGGWENQKFLMNDNEIIFPNGNKHLFESQCSKPCSFGYVKQIKQGGQKCCWNCKKCDEHAYIVDEFTCLECELGYWPYKNLTGCEKLPIEYLKWTEPTALFALIICLLGILLNTFILIVFIRNANTCVVKSTTRELSFIILVGTFLCYLMTVPMLLEPSILSCYLSRILPGFSLSLVYGALMTKTNRISRLLTRSKKRILTQKLRFMSLTAQIVITLMIILIECGFIGFSIIWESTISVVSYAIRNRPREQCFYSTLAIICPLGLNLFLVIMCTFYAIRTRNLPENFNEAKFIGFSMYVTCVIWIAFFPIYFGSDFKIITLCLSTSLSATVILIFLFVPKVYIILCKPERNQRSAFATNKDLRMHFGSSPTIVSSEVGTLGRKSELKTISKRCMNQQSISKADTFRSTTLNLSSEQSTQTHINRSCQTSYDSLPKLPETSTNLKFKQKRSLSFNGFYHSLNSTHSMYLKHENERIRSIRLHASLSLTSDSSCKTPNDITRSSQTLNLTDIESDFMSRLDNEDLKFEALRSLIELKQDNFVLNWDYVQSSDYL